MNLVLIDIDKAYMANILAPCKFLKQDILEPYRFFFIIKLFCNIVVVILDTKRSELFERLGVNLIFKDNLVVNI